MTGTPHYLSAVTHSPMSSSSCCPQDVLAEFNRLLFRSWITWNWKDIIRAMFCLKHPSPHISRHRRRTLRDYPEVTRFCFQYQTEPQSPYRRSRWTHRDFSSVKLPPQGVTYPQRCFRQTILRVANKFLAFPISCFAICNTTKRFFSWMG
jgi:hypothetical protein